MGYNLYISSPLWAVSSLLPVALVGGQARGFPLSADGEAAGDNFLTEPLVNILPDFGFESPCIKAGTLDEGSCGGCPLL